MDFDFQMRHLLYMICDVAKSTAYREGFSIRISSLALSGWRRRGKANPRLLLPAVQRRSGPGNLLPGATSHWQVTLNQEIRVFTTFKLQGSKNHLVYACLYGKVYEEEFNEIVAKRSMNETSIICEPWQKLGTYVTESGWKLTDRILWARLTGPSRRHMTHVRKFTKNSLQLS